MKTTKVRVKVEVYKRGIEKDAYIRGQRVPVTHSLCLPLRTCPGVVSLVGVTLDGEGVVSQVDGLFNFLWREEIMVSEEIKERTIL